MYIKSKNMYKIVQYKNVCDEIGLKISLHPIFKCSKIVPVLQKNFLNDIGP